LFWCGDRIIDETHLDDAVLFGKTVEKKNKEEDYYILPDNWLTMEIFIMVQTQWRLEQGVILGLDYNVLEWIFKLKQKDIKKPLELFADLQVLEGKIVETINKKNK
tara:strand:- start:8451 stop:8768 length:318 start_codon:yes stop_codon:yes gene_type:complete